MKKKERHFLGYDIKLKPNKKRKKRKGRWLRVRLIESDWKLIGNWEPNKNQTEKIEKVIATETHSQLDLLAQFQKTIIYDMFFILPLTSE